MPDQPTRETRVRIEASIRQFPGIHLRALERETGLSGGLLSYHLKELEHEGLVASREIHGYMRYFPGARSPGPHLTAEDQVYLGTLRERIPFTIVAHLLEAGGLLHKELVARVGLSKSTISYHLKKLVKAGVLLRSPAEADRRFSLSDPERVRRLIRDYRPTPELLDEFSVAWSEFYREGPRK